MVTAIPCAPIEPAPPRREPEGKVKGKKTKKSIPRGEENTGRWTKAEHAQFLDGLQRHGKEWKSIADMIKTRTVVQIRTHAQKYFQKIQKSHDYEMNCVQVATKAIDGPKPLKAKKRPTKRKASDIHSSLPIAKPAKMQRATEGESYLVEKKGFEENVMMNSHMLPFVSTKQTPAFGKLLPTIVVPSDIKSATERSPTGIDALFRFPTLDGVFNPESSINLFPEGDSTFDDIGGLLAEPAGADLDLLNDLSFDTMPSFELGDEMFSNWDKGSDSCSSPSSLDGFSAEDDALVNALLF